MDLWGVDASGEMQLIPDYSTRTLLFLKLGASLCLSIFSFQCICTQMLQKHKGTEWFKAQKSLFMF